MKYLNFIFILFSLHIVSAQEGDSISRKKIDAIRITEAPKIDGVLDELIWNSASVATNFIEREPNNGTPIPDSLHTEVRIVYDDLGIYFGAIMNDPNTSKIAKKSVRN